MRLNRTITAKNRDDLMEALRQAALGSTVEIVDDPRTSQQNRLMWALLNKVAEQVLHCGERWEPEDYKAAFLKAMGKRLRFMPALDGQGVVAIGYRSSRLSKDEMSEMIERIYEYGQRHGVMFHLNHDDAA
jgi:hypothetical protein